MGWRTTGSLTGLVHRDERLTKALQDFALGRLGVGWAEQALQVYRSPLEAGAEHLSLFLAWALHHWRMAEGLTVSEAFLARHGEELSVADRAWLRSQAAARVSFWEVRERVPGVGLRVRDWLGDETRFIQEEGGSKWFPLDTTWLARVVEHEGVSLYRGLHVGCLRQPEVDRRVRATRHALQGRPGRDEQVLRVIQAWTGYSSAGTQPC
jgi:hypothetical protein